MLKPNRDRGTVFRRPARRVYDVRSGFWPNAVRRRFASCHTFGSVWRKSIRLPVDTPSSSAASRDLRLDRRQHVEHDADRRPEPRVLGAQVEPVAVAGRGVVGQAATASAREVGRQRVAEFEEQRAPQPLERLGLVLVLRPALLGDDDAARWACAAAARRNWSCSASARRGRWRGRCPPRTARAVDRRSAWTTAGGSRQHLGDRRRLRVGDRDRAARSGRSSSSGRGRRPAGRCGTGARRGPRGRSTAVPLAFVLPTTAPPLMPQPASATDHAFDQWSRP